MLENHEQDSVQRRDAEGAEKRRAVELQSKERGLSQAAAESLANGGWGYRTVFRTRTCCGLGQPALRFGSG